MNSENTAELLPCGCVIGTYENAFFMKPCSLLCQYYLYMLEKAKEHDTPILTHILRGEGN